MAAVATKVNVREQFNQPIGASYTFWPLNVEVLKFAPDWEYDGLEPGRGGRPGRGVDKGGEDYLCGEFNQPIVGTEWPPILEELSFGDSFNHPLVGVEWPSSLQYLIFV